MLWRVCPDSGEGRALYLVVAALEHASITAQCDGGYFLNQLRALFGLRPITYLPVLKRKMVIDHYEETVDADA